LWDGGMEIRVGGVDLRTPSELDTCVLAVAHSGRDGWSRIGDIVDFLRLLNSGLAQEGDVRSWRSRLTERAIERGAGPRLELALEVARRFDPTLPRSRPGVAALARNSWLAIAAGENRRSTQTSGERLRLQAYRAATSPFPEALPWWLWKAASEVEELLRRSPGGHATGVDQAAVLPVTPSSAP
jgi:hypothetical protein